MITRHSVKPVLQGLWHCRDEKCFDCPFRAYKANCKKALLSASREIIMMLMDERGDTIGGEDFDGTVDPGI